MNDPGKLTNKKLIACIEELLNTLAAFALDIDQKNLKQIKKNSLADKEYDKFTRRLIKFYGKMHASMVLLKNEHP